MPKKKKRKEVPTTSGGNGPGAKRSKEADWSDSEGSESESSSSSSEEPQDIVPLGGVAAIGGPGKESKPGLLDRVGFREVFKKFTNKKHVRITSGAPAAGLKPGKKNVHERKPQPYTTQRLSQLLVHFSNAVLTTAKQILSDGVLPVEVQTMYVNGHALVSANKNETRDKAEKMLTSPDTLKSAVQQIAAQYAGDAKSVGGIDGRHATKLWKVLQGERLAAPVPHPGDREAEADERAAVELAVLLRRTLVEKPPVVRLSVTEAAKLITQGGGGGQGKIIIVDGPCPHAEQNLVLALVRSGYGGPATVAGAKRPCLGCYVTLLYAVERVGVKLQFDRQRGRYWQETASGLADLVNEHVRQLADAAKSPVPTEKEVLAWIEASVPREIFESEVDPARATLSDSETEPLIPRGKPRALSSSSSSSSRSSSSSSSSED